MIITVFDPTLDHLSSICRLSILFLLLFYFNLFATFPPLQICFSCLLNGKRACVVGFLLISKLWGDSSAPAQTKRGSGKEKKKGRREKKNGSASTPYLKVLVPARAGPVYLRHLVRFQNSLHPCSRTPCFSVSLLLCLSAFENLSDAAPLL
jgi:hypothetical protein